MIESTMWIARDDDDLEVVITGEYEPGEATIWRDSDGSGHPGTPPGFRDIRAETLNGEVVTLTADEEERAEEILLNDGV